MRKLKASEADLAKVVVSHLHEWGWEVYQEVEGCGGRCDIVAKRGKILWGIECKMSFGLPVIEQAMNWRHRCNYVSVAVPSGPSRFGRDICQDYGLGVLVAKLWRDDGEWGGEVIEQVKPKLFRYTTPLKLHEEQKTFCAAGTNQGGHWTLFKRTKRGLVNLVARKPGIEFNKLIKEIDHHYSSLGTAKSCLRKFIGTDVIPELKVEIVDRKLCVFPADYIVPMKKEDVPQQNSLL